ncbi:MAG: hypothetical protein HZA22_00260 [Nitrospirae bacterium]|nr:hypothetical protein [Nitrospirota bacterium]MBI5694389.1 hypothetical protein [Nitrospirota bacterium]
MTLAANSSDNVNRRHLAGFRLLQRGALKVYKKAVRTLSGDDADADASKSKTPLVKPTDMKTLVSTYNDAVAGERTVLGMDTTSPKSSEPEEVQLVWVIDETAGPGGATSDQEQI